jgi:hypothetical protein
LATGPVRLTPGCSLLYLGSPVPAGADAIASEVLFRNWVTTQVATIPGLAVRVPENASHAPIMTWDHLYNHEVARILGVLDISSWVASLVAAGIRGSFAICWEIRSAGRGSAEMVWARLLF